MAAFASSSVYTKIIGMVPYLPDELEMAAASIDDPAVLGYFIASTMRLKTGEKQELLEIFDPLDRLNRVADILDVVPALTKRLG